MTTLVTTRRGEHPDLPISTDVSVARGLLDRGGLLQLLDRAVTKRVTVISAPPGSGKTSLLRAWADRSANLHPVAFVSVERGQQNAQQFWCAVLDAIRRPARSIDPETQPAPTAALDADQVVDRVLSEVAEQAEPVVLIIDDLHELRSARPSRSSSICSRFCRAQRASCCRLAGIRRSGCTSSGSSARSPRSGPAIYDSLSARHANCSRGPRSVCRTPARPRCTSARKAGRLACASR